MANLSQWRSRPISDWSITTQEATSTWQMSLKQQVPHCQRKGGNLKPHAAGAAFSISQTFSHQKIQEACLFICLFYRSVENYLYLCTNVRRIR